MYGIELDEPTAYAGLTRGPLTDDSVAGGAVAAAPAASTTAVRGAGDKGGWGGTLTMQQLECEQRRLALASLEPHVAAAFEEWFRSVPSGPLQQVRAVGWPPVGCTDQRYRTRK